MESQALVLEDPNLLAQFVRESEFKTFFEKRFAAPPDLAALLFRDGAFVDAYKGTQFSIGGLWENMKGIVGGSHHYAVMLADLKPFQVQFPIHAMSRDKVEIAGVATLELQLDPEHPGNILGLMRGVSRNQGASSSAETGRKALSIFDVTERLEPQFQDRIFEYVIGRHDADEVRGNRGLQDEVQADMMKEAERLCGDIGLMVRNASLTFAMNEAEREEFEKARIERQQAMLDYQLELLKREIGREGEATEVKLKSDVDTAKLQRAGQDELALMVLNSEVAFVDAREAAARRQEMEALQHEIEVLRTERAGKFENQLAEAGQQIDLTKETLRLRQVQLEIDRLDQDYRRQMARADRDMADDFALRDIDISGKKTDEGMRQTRGWQDIARENLEKTNKIEGDKADRDTDRDLHKKDVEADIRMKEDEATARNNIDQSRAWQDMTPEQLAIVLPGISRKAADVAIEQAKAKGANADEMLKMARELMNESREHEHRMFDTGMKGGTGMAAGLGGGKVGPDGQRVVDTVECPNCGKVLSAKARFCSGCQHQMRT